MGVGWFYVGILLQRHHLHRLFLYVADIVAVVAERSCCACIARQIALGFQYGWVTHFRAIHNFGCFFYGTHMVGGCGNLCKFFSRQKCLCLCWNLYTKPGFLPTVFPLMSAHRFVGPSVPKSKSIALCVVASPEGDRLRVL